MQDYFLKERGVAYRTNDFKTDRKTLVFVHGLSGSLSAWYPFEARLKDTYNLVTYDLRGHGLSLRPSKSGYATGEFVADLRALLSHLHIERCTLISHSFGTLIAMEFARAYPAAIERLIFLAPAYDVRKFRITRLLSNIAAAAALAPLRIRGYGRTDYARFYPTGDFSPLRIAADISNMGLRSYLRSLSVLFTRDYTPGWDALAAPTLIIHGSRDAMVPVSHSKTLAGRLPRAELLVLPGANHILVLNNVPEVAAAIEKFVQQ